MQRESESSMTVMNLKQEILQLKNSTSQVDTTQLTLANKKV